MRSMILCSVMFAAVGGCIPAWEEPSDPSIRIPAGEPEVEPAPPVEPAGDILVSSVSAEQDGAFLDVTVGLSTIGSVELDVTIGADLYSVIPTIDGLSATVRIAVDPCATFGRSVSVAATVPGSDVIEAVVVHFDGHIAEAGETVTGLAAFCDDTAVFAVGEPRDFWIGADGPLDLLGATGMVSAGQELAIHLDRGDYTVTTTGAFVVVSAE